MESYSCWASVINKYKMDTSRVETIRKKVQECKTATDFFFFLWEEKRGGVGWFSDSCQPAPPTHCLQHLLWSHKPLCLPWAGPIVPIHVDRHSVRREHHLPQCSRSFRALITNSWETTAAPRLTQLAHKQLICLTNQQGKLQVQGCSIDNGVKSMELIPPPSHILSTSTVILFWYWISFLNY